jgi:hypothetical protein
MRSPWFVMTGLVVLLSGIAFVRMPTAPRTVEYFAPVRPSRHAAPPEDVEALNAAGPRRVPDSLIRLVVPDDRPAVVLFLKADCGCSEEFARMFTALEPRLAERASCLAVIEAADGDAGPFLTSSGLATPHVTQSSGGLAASWGVTKAGCVALVRPDGTVDAIWPGISRQGFRDLAGRLGDQDLLPPESLALLPGAATAGCPLQSASLVSRPGVSP